MSGSYGALNSKYLTLQAQLNALGGSIGSGDLQSVLDAGNSATESLIIQGTATTSTIDKDVGFTTTFVEPGSDLAGSYRPGLLNITNFLTSDSVQLTPTEFSSTDTYTIGIGDVVATHARLTSSECRVGTPTVVSAFFTDGTNAEASCTSGASSLTIEATPTTSSMVSTTPLTIDASDISMDGQVSFNLPPHSVEPVLGNDLATKGYVDTLIGNYGGNGLPLYFNIASANPNPILVYPITADLEQTLVPVNATPPASNYTLTTTALGTDQLLATFTTPVGYPNTLTIPSGLWNMLIYGYASGTGGQLFYHFHLSELKADTTVVPIAVSGFSSDVNATNVGDPDTFHASLAITTPYTMDSLNSRLIVEIYSTGTGMGGGVQLNTLFGGIYYSFVSTSLSGGTSILTTNNNWTGDNIWSGSTNEFTTGLSTQYVEALTPNAVVGLYTGQIAGGNITLGSALVDTTVDGTLKATTPLTNTNNTVVPTTAWVNTFFALASSLSAYLTTATAAATYQTIAGMSAYLTTATAASTYQTLAGMSAYLTTATAASTYQTLAGMSAYLTTATAAATYATIASLSAYGAKATTNTWDLLQSFTVGVQTQSIVATTTTTDVSLFTTNTAGTVGINSTTGTVRCGGAKFLNSTTNLTINNQLGNADIYIGNEQSNAFLYLGAGGGTRTGTVILGRDGCPITVNGAPTFSATATATFNNGLSLASGKYITTTAGVGTNPTALQIGRLETGTALNAGGVLTSSNWITVGSGMSLGSGMWIIIGYVQLSGLDTATRVALALGPTLKSNTAVNTGAFDYGISTAFVIQGSAQYVNISGFYQNLTASAVNIYMNLRLHYTGTQPTIGGSDFQYRAVKIA